MNHSDRNALVVEHLHIVGYVVSDVWGRIPYLSRDDLSSAGAEALVRASQSFDPAMNVPFGAFARQRIRGALIDEVRKYEWMSRSAVKRVRDNKGVRDSLTQTLGRAPSVEEMASALGIEVSEVREGLSDESRSLMVIDETVAALAVCPEPTPESAALQTEENSFLAKAVAALPKSMRYVIEQVYFGDRTVSDVAAEMGVTHSNVSQQRAEGLRLIRDAIESRDGTGAEPTSRVSPKRRAAYMDNVRDMTSGGLAGRRTFPLDIPA